MKMKMFRRTLSKRSVPTIMFIAFLVCATTVASFVSPVKANPINVEVSPPSGTMGMSVKVSGDDATEGGEIRVYIAAFIISFFAATTNADPMGEYSVNITVPAFPVGPYSILVLDVETGDTAIAPFTIRPKIKLTAEAGASNDEVTVEGYGFASGSLITLTFDGDDVTPWPEPQTDEFGSFKATFVIPSVPNGTYTVEASDETNHALASFTVIPKITLSPTSGSSATTVFVNGTGFASASTMSIEFDNINVTMYPALPTNLDGSFMQIFFVPDLPDGSYTVNATDDAGSSASAKFLVPSPTLILDPSTAFQGSIVTARGAGFPPAQPVLLYLEENMMIDLVELMTGSQAFYTDEYGEYEYSFVVPVVTPGVYRVVAYSLAGFGFTIGEELTSTSLTIVEDAILVEIRDKIATIIIPDLGIIKQNLTAIDARLINIEGTTVTINSTIGVILADIAAVGLEVAAVNGNVATLQTTLGTIEGRIISIEGETATIETDIGTIKADISNVKGTQESYVIPMYAGIGLVLIAAIASIFLTIIHVQAMRRASPE